MNKSQYNLFDKIKSSTEYVMNNSNYVKINYDKLNDFIKKIKCGDLKNWLLYNPYNLLDLSVEDIVNFLFIFEAIDYSFWGNPKCTIKTEDGLKDGSDALLYVMLKYIKENSIMDLINLSFDEFKKMLKGNVEILF